MTHSFPRPFSLFSLYLLPILLLALLLNAVTAHAQFGKGIDTPPENHIKPELVAEANAVRPGDTVTLAFVMTADKGWHGYWENPGDAGFGMQPEWTLPAGITAGELKYPVPTTLYVGDLMNYIYKGNYTVLVPLTIGGNVAEGPVNISVKMDWLACTDKVCVPESGSFETSIMVSKAATPMADIRSTSFDSYREKLAAPLGSEGTFAIDGNVLRLAIPYPASGQLDNPYFFPSTADGLAYSTPLKFFRDGDKLIIEAGANDTDITKLEGVLRVAPGIGLQVTANKGDVTQGGKLVFTTAGPDGLESAEATDAPASKPSILLFLGALGGAILGGLILNIMPCVFPILSLKAISLAKIGGDEGKARREAVAYTLGIVLVSIALGAVMLGLRAAGEQVGWAFQLQDPRIVFVLLIVVVAISFNLAGLFEIGSITAGDKLTSGGGTGGAFWTGVLAAFVATPCTGPFMAVAMGTALILPAYAALLVFAGLGLGLALPFLLLGFIPAMRKWLPKPGAWMETFRRVMSVPMFLTALALIWLLGQQAGSNMILFAVAAAMLATFFLWWAGLRQRAGKSATVLLILPLILVIVSGIYALQAYSAETTVAASDAASSDETLPSEAFSNDRLAALRAEGRPVFVYFTADWCITCKVNEASALQREDTAKVFADANVAVLKGDWTRRDAEITRFLEANGRSGVPLYVYYPVDGEPQILPQVLTVNMLTALVKR